MPGGSSIDDVDVHAIPAEGVQVGTDAVVPKGVPGEQVKKTGPAGGRQVRSGSEFAAFLAALLAALLAAFALALGRGLHPCLRRI